MMRSRLHLEIQPQPDEAACGPTCLHAVYQYYGDGQSLPEVIAEVPSLDSGGTLAVFLGCHALGRGYRATLYTYNLQVFDPTWFQDPTTDLRSKLDAQRQHKTSPKLRVATQAFIDFLDAGGELRFEDLTTSLIRRHLKRSVPILTGLSATYLYRTARELGAPSEFDDIRGDPAGHFVVLCGYDKRRRQVLVADPLHPNPMAEELTYPVDIDRVVCSILLGILTYDGNLLLIEPVRKGRAG